MKNELPNYPNVMCLWRWGEKTWELAESYQVDGDGEAVYRGATEVGDWMGGGEYKTPGRAVTYWNAMSGVSLHRFSPPSECPWLDEWFAKNLLKMENWHELIRGGSGLLFGTTRAAQEIFHKMLADKGTKRRG